jgi:hypothetical protein
MAPPRGGTNLNGFKSRRVGAQSGRTRVLRMWRTETRQGLRPSSTSSLIVGVLLVFGDADRQAHSQGPDPACTLVSYFWSGLGCRWGSEGRIGFPVRNADTLATEVPCLVLIALPSLASVERRTSLLAESVLATATAAWEYTLDRVRRRGQDHQPTHAPYTPWRGRSR